jgi:NAD(P)-dependent dehydrogenase (short-subunit alcohol dehydrogenase family)
MALRSKTFPLPGAVVVVTGGARGIGRATAQAFHRAGARVAVGDLDGDLAAEVAGELGEGTFAARLDVTERASFLGFLTAVESALGPVDVLVNNAGIMPLAELVDEPDALTRRIVDVNLHGVITGTKLVAPGMVARGRGHVVNVASAVGRVALAGAATYSASKYAVVGFSEAMRSELGRSGVHVSCVLPTVVETELATGIGSVRGQRPVTPEEVAATIVEVAAAPRPETWVPRRSRALFVAASLLPHRLKDGVSRALGAHDILHDPDAAARAAYDRRTRGDLQPGA